MPYVPCPPNSTVNWSLSGPSGSYRTVKDKTGVETVTSYSWPTYVERHGFRLGSGGPFRLINGRKWAPCRAYQRSGWEVRYLPRSAVYRSLDQNPNNATKQYWDGLCTTSYVIGNSGFPSFSQIGSQAGFTLTSDGVGSLTTNEVGRINTQLLAKAGQRQVNWGETLGESKSTVRMLTRAFSTLIRAFMAARRGKFNLVAKLLKVRRLRLPKSKSVAEKWLAYQYGWAPLMGDVYDSYKFLQRGFNTRMQVLAVTTRFTIDISQKWSHNHWDKNTVSGTKRCSGKMFYRLADNFLSRLNQVGLINPAEVAWALVPFSFVVDWFVPVGRYLEALSARVGLTFVDGYYGCSVQTRSVLKGYKRTPGAYVLMGTNSSEIHRVSSSYRRTVMTSLPWPQVHVKSPFSTIHVASALALLRQLWR